jgi:small subunit ribosomal protein S1
MEKLSFAELMNDENTFTKVKTGNIIDAIIVAITHRHIVVDLNFKSEGYINITDVADYKGEHGLSVGDLLSVFVESSDDGFGVPVLSYEKALQTTNRNSIIQAQKDKAFITVCAKSITNRGIVVDFNKTECFLPFSLADISFKKDYSFLINTSFQVGIVKYNFEKNNILVSRKAFLEKERGLDVSDIIQKLKVGDEIEGTVKNIAKYGAFVELYFMDSLVHINDLSWKQISSPNEVIKQHESYKFIISAIDLKLNRISLSLKDYDINPWLNIVNKHNTGDILNGVVSSINQNGLFVRVNDEIDFYVHHSELSWNKIKNTINSHFKVGDKVKCCIKEIKNKDKSLLLSIKDTIENPFQKFSEEFSEGDLSEGVIKSIGSFELVVSLNDDLNGVIPVEEISWGYDNNKTNNFAVGDKIEFKIKTLKDHKVILSIKEIHEDPLNTYRTMKKGTTLNVNVLSVNKDSVKILTSDGIQGFVDLKTNMNLNLDDIFEIEQNLEVDFIGIKNRYIQVKLTKDLFNNNNVNPTIGDIIK